MERYRLDPENSSRLTATEQVRLAAMSETKIIAAALQDADNPPLSDAELVRIGASVALRKHTGLSQV
jgi:hypothetical protein